MKINFIHKTEVFNNHFPVKNRKCYVCGNMYFHNTKLNIPDNNCCNVCKIMYDAWYDIHINKSVDTLIINRRIFSVGSENDKHKGFAGRKITIEYLNGKKVTTTNLWCGLNVPDVWCKDYDLVDTAKWSSND